MEYTLTGRQARQFILLKHGLLGPHRFIGKEGALNFVRQAGCIQFDPIDACGRNADLVLQSRVKKYRKAILDELLYTDRALVDYPDKNLAIIPVADWPYFERLRKLSRQHGQKYPAMQELINQAKTHIETHGATCSDDLKVDGDFYWHSAIHWSGGNRLSRSVLEQMYATGELIIHHKNRTRKYYDLASRHIPADLLDTPDPLPDEFEYQKWQVLRRIGSVGLLWNRASDAWLGISGLKAPVRDQIFARLLDDGEITAVMVAGIDHTLYCLTADTPLLEQVLADQPQKPRCELIAPLDNLMWDRRLIKALFAFDYTWEIYTPADKRKYGYYVLPLLYGDAFVGRVEVVADYKNAELIVRHIWYEDGIRQTKKLEQAVMKCLRCFAAFNHCDSIQYL